MSLVKLSLWDYLEEGEDILMSQKTKDFAWFVNLRKSNDGTTM
jgi:hypothetical protein